MRWGRILAGVAAVGLAFCTMQAGIMMCEAFLHPDHRPASAKAVQTAHDMASAVGAGMDDIEIRAGDGVRLRGWFFTAAHPRGSAVVVLHGQGDNRGGASGFAEMFLARGYDVLTPDARAHGTSEGSTATYGLKEADDLKRWAEWLIGIRHERQVFGLGESMGAAILLQAAGAGAPFTAVVAESPFSTLREVAYDRILNGMGRTLLRPVVESGFLYGRMRYGIDMEAISPANGAVRARMPILLIHGLADDSILPDHSRRIQALGRWRIQLWLVPGAGHTAASSTAPAEFERRVTAWFERR